MAALTHKQEYAVIRLAIQTLQSGAAVASFTLGNMSVSYYPNQLDWLQAREETLSKRLTQRNVRKRTYADFTG